MAALQTIATYLPALITITEDSYSMRGLLFLEEYRYNPGDAVTILDLIT